MQLSLTNDPTNHFLGIQTSLVFFIVFATDQPIHIYQFFFPPSLSLSATGGFDAQQFFLILI